MRGEEWRQRADAAVGKLSSVFDPVYSVVGRPSIPPERLLKASLLMDGLTSVRFLDRLNLGCLRFIRARGPKKKI